MNGEVQPVFWNTKLWLYTKALVTLAVNHQQEVPSTKNRVREKQAWEGVKMAAGSAIATTRLGNLIQISLALQQLNSRCRSEEFHWGCLELTMGKRTFVLLLT